MQEILKLYFPCTVVFVFLFFFCKEIPRQMFMVVHQLMHCLAEYKKSKD